MLMSEITSTASIKWVSMLCLLPESFYPKVSVKQLLDLSLCKHCENTVVRSCFMQTLKQGSHSLEKALNSIFSWEVLKCLCKSLKSRWIFFNLKFSGLESVFWCFLVVKTEYISLSKTTEQWPNYSIHFIHFTIYSRLLSRSGSWAFWLGRHRNTLYVLSVISPSKGTM